MSATVRSRTAQWGESSTLDGPILVTGPNTIVEAERRDQRAAAMIVRHIRGQELIALELYRIMRGVPLG